MEEGSITLAVAASIIAGSAFTGLSEVEKTDLLFYSIAIRKRDVENSCH